MRHDAPRNVLLQHSVSDSQDFATKNILKSAAKQPPGRHNLDTMVESWIKKQAVHGSFNWEQEVGGKESNKSLSSDIKFIVTMTYLNRDIVYFCHPPKDEPNIPGE